jgi:spore germination cell wall hydrolase CwlJ-like protein
MPFKTGAPAATAADQPNDAPPPSSLRRLAPDDQARWEKAAGQFTAPSATPARPFVHAGGGADRGRALECLATAIYYEARSESGGGQRAVAQVVLNRARHPAFPASVCGVVYQGSERRTGCQFSFTCDGSLRWRPRGAAWDKARSIAAEALGGAVYAPVGNATHYHTTAILPYWAPSLTRSAVIGAHVFYRWRGAAGRASAFLQNPSAREEGRVARASAPTLETPRLDRGKDRVETAQYVRVDSATVTIYRGGASEAGERVEYGVRIHGGTPAPATS